MDTAHSSEGIGADFSGATPAAIDGGRAEFCCAVAAEGDIPIAGGNIGAIAERAAEGNGNFEYRMEDGLQDGKIIFQGLMNRIHTVVTYYGI